MADNPYGLKVDLNTNEMAVEVKVRKKIGDGDYQDVDSKAFPLSEIAEEVMDQVRLYGLSKKLQDGASSVPAGPDKLEEMTSIFDALKEGKWERDRKSTGPTVSAEVEALAQLKGCSIPAIQKTLGTLTTEQKEKALAHEKVVALAAEIKAARSTAEEVDLSEFGI